MMMNDPLGDMLTRIRNAQMRGKSTVTTPASQAPRLGARCAGGRRLHPRLREGHDRQRSGRARDQPEVLRRHPGDPRTQARVEARPPRLHGRQGHSAGPQRPRCLHRLHAERRHVRCSMHAPPMLAAKCSAPCSEEGAMSRIGKKPVALPKGVSATISGQTVEVKGPKGTRSFTATDDVTLTHRWRRREGDPARHVQAGAPAVGHGAVDGGEPRDGRDDRLQERAGDQGVGYRAAMAGQRPEAVARLQPRRELRRARPA